LIHTNIVKISQNETISIVQIRSGLKTLQSPDSSISIALIEA